MCDASFSNFAKTLTTSRQDSRGSLDNYLQPLGLGLILKLLCFYLQIALYGFHLVEIPLAACLAKIICQNHPFDDSILKLFRDGKPREFQQILAEVEFSHYMLIIPLDKLAERGLINKNKQPAKGLGRPKIIYSTFISALRSSTVPLNSSPGVVRLAFSKLSRVCQFEKCGFCMKVRGSCSDRICPQIL